MNSYFQSLATGVVGEDDDSGDVMVGMMYLVTMATSFIVVVIGMVLVEVVVKLRRKKDDSGHEVDVDR